MTPGDFDVIRLLHVDEERHMIYFIASPDSATERFLYRARFDGTGVERVTPADATGVHDYRFADDGRWAVHSWSSANWPEQTELVSMPDHQRVCPLEANGELFERLEKLDRTATEFFRVDIGAGVQLDAWCIKPPDFDPAGSYPLLVHVYGEPAGATVVNRWGGSNSLWHLMLAQQGYVVMSFDNRGAKVPRGRAWRKCVYGRIGILGPQDQAAAVRAVLRERSWLDPERVGIWGWSGGGSSSLHAIFKYPDLYSTAIAVAPVPNQCYYDTMYQERYMGLPASNVDGYREGSAINFASQLEGNLLLVHGTADDNCHYQTVEMLIDELIAHDKQFSLMVYPNRTHAVKERRNTTPHLREMMTQFLLEHLPVEP
jgi:dipeptidyl-peptidase-4